IRKFLAGGIEGFDHSICKQNQSIARLENGRSGRKNGVRANAKRKAGGFEPVDSAVLSPDHGKIVAGIDEFQMAGGGIIFCNDGGCESLTAEAMRAGIVIQALRKLNERHAFGGEGAKAGLES